MSRNVLLIGGAVVLVAGIGLVLLLGGEDSTASTSSTSSEGSAVVVTTPGTRPTGTDSPSLPGGAPSLPAGDEQHPRDYVVGDVRVRDHRAGNNPPMDIPPNVHPAEGREIPSTIVHDISQKVRGVMMQCVADLPREARGTKPRLEGQIVIAIKDKKLTVTKSVMQLRDVTGDAADATKQCIESKTVGLDAAATDQADIDAYSINLTFAIP